ncbi:MAG: helix-turn-helix domain-containing protein [Acidimicrobiales bacterium]
MPKISAASVAEHVEQQRAAVSEAALRLFVERGYHAVSLGDIAAEVGLARSSLYRYVPDKAHLLVEWFRRELPVEAARSAEVLDRPGTPLERLQGWALEQLAYARTPEHVLVSTLAEVAPQLDEPTRIELAQAHGALFAPLLAVVEEAGLEGADARAAVALLGGMVLAAGRHEADGGDREAVEARLLAGVAGLMEPSRGS